MGAIWEWIKNFFSTEGSLGVVEEIVDTAGDVAEALGYEEVAEVLDTVEDVIEVIDGDDEN